MTDYDDNCNICKVRRQTTDDQTCFACSEFKQICFRCNAVSDDILSYIGKYNSWVCKLCWDEYMAVMER